MIGYKDAKICAAFEKGKALAKAYLEERLGPELLANVYLVCPVIGSIWDARTEEVYKRLTGCLFDQASQMEPDDLVFEIKNRIASQVILTLRDLALSLNGA